ncbi:hypothetical protein OGAPHI_007202 [Ogataea philodendri]|uniref:Uncharacterized protein n=1 Tax=Ogataea philodendri TaxID=1378263 RepID=A0A9P8NVH4_9ASCO|nr:uncharacterized protein OGAPHI_007202 [Ogataea philodendri]KAH3659997.1 hypothetical protein OGAPHI_007202 [Ogataea philodendri]
MEQVEENDDRNGQSSSESDVTEADGAPSEDRGQTRQSHQPCEHFVLFGGSSQETQQSNKQSDTNTNKRSSCSVDVAKPFGTESLLRQGSDGSATCEDSRVSDRKHSYQNDNVHDGRQHFNSVVSNGDDERRRGDVDGGASQKTVVVVANEESHHCKRNKVEQGDSPEDLFGGSWQSLSRVFGLCCSQTAELCTTETECSGDKHGTKTFESRMERTWIMPVAGSNDLMGWATPTHKNHR